MEVTSHFVSPIKVNRRLPESQAVETPNRERVIKSFPEELPISKIRVFS
jgi:hypothetical protein